MTLLPTKIILILSITSILLILSSISATTVTERPILPNRIIREYNPTGLIIHSLHIPRYSSQEFLLLEQLDTGLKTTRNPLFYISKTKITADTYKSSEWTTENKNSTSILIQKENVLPDTVLYIAVVCEKCLYDFTVKLLKEHGNMPRHFPLHEL